MTSIRLVLLFCVIVWGWTFVATKICLNYLNPIELVGLRFLIGLPLLYAVIRIKSITIEFTQREYRSLAIGAAIIGLHFLLQNIALNYTTATNTGWIIAAIPLAMAILSYLILKEKIGRKEIIGIIVATFGIVLLISKGNFTSIGWLSSVGDWMILASAHTWALYTIATRNVARARSPLAVTLFVFAPVMVLCTLYTLLFSDIRQLLAMPSDGWIALIFLGVLGTLTQWFWQIAVAKIGAARAGIFLYLEPVATTALAVPLLKESFGAFTALGGVLVMLGVWWAQKK